MTLGELLTIFGLLMDAGAVCLLTLFGMLGDNPYRTLYVLYFKTNRDDLSDQSSGAYALSGPSVNENPNTQKEYDESIQLAAKQSIGILLFVIGFLLQIVGVPLK